MPSVFDPSQLNKFIAYLWTPYSVIGTGGMKMNGHSHFPLGPFCLMRETHTHTDRSFWYNLVRARMLKQPKGESYKSEEGVRESFERRRPLIFQRGQAWDSQTGGEPADTETRE